MPLPSSLETAYERNLLDRAAGWPGYGTWYDLTADALRRLAGVEGIDFATALLYDRVARSAEFGPFIERLESYPETAEGCRTLDATVVVAPGAFYVEYPHTGADGRLLREEAARFGCRCEVIPVASFGSLEANARTICDWLARRPEEPVILVSLSKGGSDVKVALARPEAEDAFRHVVVWVNLCGLVQGTPLVPWLFARPLRTLCVRLLFWFRGFDFGVVREMAYGPDTPLAGELRLPEHLKLINIVGFPLACHATNALARRWHRRLRPLGPNDAAGILLADACRLPGLVYPVWGADHYMRPSWGDVRTVAVRLLHYLSEEWDALVLQQS